MLIKTSRRDFVRGLGIGSGALLLAPIARGLIREANAEETFEPKAIFYANNLGIAAHSRPTPGPTPEDFSLVSFDPLEPYREDLLYLYPLFNPFDHHLHGSYWPLTVQPGHGGDPRNSRPSGPGGISFDRFLGAELGASTPFPSLTLSTSGDADNPISADGTQQRFPALYDPAAAFDEVFGATAGLDEGQLRERFDKDRSILDYVRGDIARMQRGLAAPETHKLEQYLESLRGMERKLDNLQQTAANCSDVQAPAELDRLDAMVELATQAVICGLTRVVVLYAGTSYSGPNLYPPEEDIGMGSHKMWHQGGGNEAAHQAFHRYHAERLRTMREQLDLIELGGRTVGEDSLIVWFNTSGGGHHGGSYDIPLVVLGDAGGRLQTGRYVELPSIPRDPSHHSYEGPYHYDGDYEPRWPKGDGDLPLHCVSDALVSLAQVMGVDIDQFGHPDFCQGPLPELLG